MPIVNILMENETEYLIAASETFLVTLERSLYGRIDPYAVKTQEWLCLGCERRVTVNSGPSY
jgi:hypothetical protein